MGLSQMQKPICNTPLFNPSLMRQPLCPLSKTFREEYVSLFSGKDLRHSKKQKKAAVQRGRIWNPRLRKQDDTRAFSTYPKTTLSLRRKAKLHAEGASLSACGKHHSPKANITVQPPHGDCTMGDREAVDEENFLSCLPPGGRETAKRWKEPAGTKAEKTALLRADMAV